MWKEKGGEVPVCYQFNEFIGFMIKASGFLDFKIKASGQRVKSLDNKIKPSK